MVLNIVMNNIVSSEYNNEFWKYFSRPDRLNKFVSIVSDLKCIDQIKTIVSPAFDNPYDLISNGEYQLVENVVNTLMFDFLEDKYQLYFLSEHLVKHISKLAVKLSTMLLSFEQEVMWDVNSA